MGAGIVTPRRRASDALKALPWLRGPDHAAILCVLSAFGVVEVERDPARDTWRCPVGDCRWLYDLAMTQPRPSPEKGDSLFRAHLDAHSHSELAVTVAELAPALTAALSLRQDAMPAGVPDAQM